MDIQAAVVTMIDALTAEQIPYMLVGSFSTSYWGVPRSTKDGDFVVVTDTQAVKLLRERLGPRFVFDPQRSFESDAATYRDRRRHRHQDRIVRPEPAASRSRAICPSSDHSLARTRSGGALRRGRDHHEALLGTECSTRQGPRRRPGRDCRPGGPARFRLHPSLGKRARHAGAARRDSPLDSAPVM